MILYGSSLSPYVRKVLAFAGEKGIELELRPTGAAVGQPSDEFLEASPLRKMPAFRDGDYTLADSSAIIHYLEAKHPKPALIPAEPKLRGKAIWFEEFADTVLVSCGAKSSSTSSSLRNSSAGPATRKRRARPRATTCRRSSTISRKWCRAATAIWSVTG